MIQLVFLHSILEKEDSLNARYQDVLHHLKERQMLDKDENQKIAILGFCDSPDKARDLLTTPTASSVSGLALAVGSGGTEDIINTIARTMPDTPLLLWANSMKNSLPAALESYAYLKNDHAMQLLVKDCDEPEQVLLELERFDRISQTLHKLNRSIVGSYGAPSSWLLTSRGHSTFGKFKTKLIFLEITELAEEVSLIPDSDARPIVQKWQQTIGTILVSDDELRNSAKVYVAMKHMIAKHNLSTITIRCFDLLSLGYTACMGMSLCNDERIVAGCEGDLQTTFTMMIATYLTGQPVWMANPAKMHKGNNTLTFAHCTIASSLLKDLSRSTLQAHMESNSSTAIQGPLHHGAVTILRVGAKFDKMTIATGVLIDSDMQEQCLCRTQAVIRLDGSVSEWVENALGNHHVIAWGSHKEDLLAFGKLARMEVTEI
jgi:L-fucose isomerase-like protein